MAFKNIFSKGVKGCLADPEEKEMLLEQLLAINCMTHLRRGKSAMLLFLSRNCRIYHVTIFLVNA